MGLLARMLRKRYFLALLSVCASGLTAGNTLWWNAQLGGIINSAGAGVPPSRETLLWAVATMLAMGVLHCAKGFLSGCTCELMAHDMRMGYALYFASLPVAEAEKCSVGEQLSKLQNEISGVLGYLHANLFQLIDDGVRFLATFWWLLLIGPKLTLLSNLPSFVLIAYGLWASKAIGAATERGQKAKGHMNQYADTLLNLFPVIRLYGAVRMALNGYAGAVKTWESQTVRAERTRARLLSLSALLSSMPLLLLFLIGGQLSISGALSVGTLYIFINLSGNVSGVLMNMPGHIAAFRQFSANMKRLSPHVILGGGGE